MLSLPELNSLISQSKTNCLFRQPHLDKNLFVLFCELVIIIWLIQVKDGKLLDEMAVSMTGLANKVGRADICRCVQTQNQFPHSPQSSASARSLRICTQESEKYTIYRIRSVTEETGFAVMMNF